jgi:NADH dehydrogenase (ubiquinone) Fe-S protein 4
LSGAPKDELERKVFVFRPAKSAGQHASASVPSYPWKLSFEKKDRWVNPLMGWTSSSDSLAGQTPGNMNFESKDAAIAFAERNGEWGIRFK